MINKMKGKGHIHRSLKVRLIAFVTALAMVLSVIYLNDRRGIVEADTPTVTVYDDSFVSSLISSSSADSVNVIVPAQGITFSVGADGTAQVSESIKLYTEDEVDYYIDGSSLTNPTEVDANAYYKTIVRSSADGSGTNPGTMTSGDTVYVLKEYVNYTDPEGVHDDYVPVDADTYKHALYKTISVATRDAAGLTFNSSSNPATVTDTDFTDTDDTKYYGSVTYAVTKDGGDETYYTSLDGLNSAFTKGVDSDGSYEINKVINAPASGSGTELFTEDASGVVNNYILKSYSAGYTETGASAETIIEGSGGVISVPASASATISATKDINVYFETDKEITPSSDVTITATGTGTIAPTVSGSGTSYSFTIPGSAARSGNSQSYAVKVKDGTLSESFTVNINNADGTATISAEKINGEPVDSSFVYVTDEEAELSAVVTVEDEAAVVNKSGFCKLTSSTIPATRTITDSAAPDSDGKITASVTLAPGENYYCVGGNTSYDGGTTTIDFPKGSVYQLFYDNVDPYVVEDSVAVESDGTAVTVNHEAGTKNYDATVSAMATTDITLNVSDMQKDGSGTDIDGSGINTVTINGTAKTPDSSGQVAYRIDPDPGKASGSSDELTVYLKDNAGREDEYKVTINYIDERASITEGFSHGTVDGSKFFKWDSSSRQATVTYTVDTNVELKSKADDGVVITVDGAKAPASQFDIEPVTPTGSYAYEYKVTFRYDPTVSKADYNIVLTVTNKNDYPTTHNTAVRSVDIDNPTIDVEGDNTKWYQNLVLNVKVSDGTVSSGFDHVDATGVNPTKFTSTPYVVTVNESTSTAGTAVSFKAFDKAGNESTTYYNTYYVDKKKPVLTLKVNKKDYKEVDGKVLPVADPVIDYTLTDSLSGIDGSDASASYFKINGTSYPGSTGKKLSEIIGKVDPKISYHIELFARDRAGNEEKYETTFKADGAKPDITGKIENTPKKDKYPTYFNENVTLTVTVTDANISKNGLKVTETGGRTIKYDWKQDGSGKWIATIKANNEGNYNVKVTATDDGGLSNSWSQTFTIDKTAPDVTTLLNGSEYTSSNSYNNTITHGVNVVDDNEDEADVAVQIEREVPGGGTESLKKKGKGPFTISEDGFYTVTYTVTDKAGNSTTKEIGFTVDNTAPANNLYVTTANPAKVDAYPNNYVNVLYVFTEHESQENYRYGQYYNSDVTIELNYFDYNLNSVYVTDGETELSPTWTENNGYGKATVTISSEGYHDIKIWTDDLAGNTTDDTDIGKRIRFTIDKTAPVISTTLNGAGYAEGSGVRYLTTNGTVGVTVSDKNIDTSDLKRIYKITPPGGATKTSESYVSEGSETYAEEADYEVQYVAVDKAGNTSTMRTVQFRVDKTAPQLSISNVGTSTTAGAVNVSFNVKEAFYWDMNAVTIKIYKKKDGSGEVLEKTIDMKPKSANDATSYTFTDDAEYRIEFTAEDKCGNKANTDYTFIKDGTAPRIVLSGVGNYDMTDKNVELMITVDEDFYTSNKVTLKGTRTDIEGKKNPITFNDFNPNRTKISEMKQLFDKDGIYDIEVTSTDKAGNSSSKKVHFTIDTEAPKIGDLSKYDGVKLREFKWDVDLDKLVTDLTVCDIGLYLDGVEYDGVSPIEDGSHVLKVVAVDEMGHKSEKEVTFILDSKGPNIIVSNVEDQDLFYEAREIGVSVQLDEDVLDNVTLNGKTIAVNDNQATMNIDKKGDYTLEAMAHDEAGNEASVKLTFTYGSETSIWWIIAIAGGAILLLLILLIIIKKKKSW